MNSEYRLQNLFKSHSKTKRIKICWTLIILLFNLIRSLLYIFFGREKFKANRR